MGGQYPSPARDPDQYCKRSEQSPLDPILLEPPNVFFAKLPQLVTEVAVDFCEHEPIVNEGGCGECVCRQTQGPIQPE